MFGPSEWDFDMTIDHHRSGSFHVFMESLENIFKERFDIPDDWTVLFVSGGGTLANEIILASCDCGVVGSLQAPFVERLRRLNKYHVRSHSNTQAVRCCVAYDTAQSKVLNVPPSNGILTFVDCVSSFPYYAPPVGIDAWSTVSSKQLGSSPGLGILVLSPKFVASVVRQDLSHSMLSLSDYLLYHDKHELPHTAPTELLNGLWETLIQFDKVHLRSDIIHRRNLLDAVVPGEFRIGVGPVFTFKQDVLPDCFNAKWGLYQGSYGPQAFLHANGDWQGFIEELRRIKWN